MFKKLWTFFSIAVILTLATAATGAVAATPDTKITAGPTNGSITNDNTPTFEFVSDDPGATFECSYDGAPFTACGSPHTGWICPPDQICIAIYPLPVPDGPHLFAVRAVNGGGEVDPTPDSRHFVVDTTPPDTKITAGPREGGVTHDNTPTFEFVSSEPDSTFECNYDGAPFTACKSPHTGWICPPDQICIAIYPLPVPDGKHTFFVRAIDAAGNVDPTPASRTFTVKACSRKC